MEIEKIILVIQEIELLLAKKDNLTLLERDSYKFTIDNPESYMTQMYGEFINFPHENDYEQTVRLLNLPNGGKIHVIYDFWIDNIKGDLSLIMDIWEENNLVKFGISDIRVM
jgi:hypothetical protein